MKATPEDLEQLAESLRTFLSEAGWRQGRQAKGMVFYYPPDNLGIQGNYSVALPEAMSKASAGGLLYGAANSLVDLYGFGSVGALMNRAASLADRSLPSRLITRFVDSSTEKGAVPLTALVAYATSLEQGLYRGAKFKLGGENKANKALAERFVKECVFLQTEHGSFITKVEVPHSILRQGDMFGVEPVVSTEVCSSIFSGLQFLNERILGDDDDFESPAIVENVISLFDVELLESLTKVVVEPGIESLDFFLEVGTQVLASSTGWLSDEKKSRLKDFLNFVRDQMRGEDDIEITGSIFELRSRDPDGNKNHIRVVADFHGDRTFASATLNNEQYQIAVDAHTSKRQVRLKGNITRLKTQIRFNSLTEFAIG